jgi:hypothetical protein
MSFFIFGGHVIHNVVGPGYELFIVPLFGLLDNTFSQVWGDS